MRNLFFKIINLLCTILCVLFLSGCDRKQIKKKGSEVVTIQSLLKEMTDRDGLAKLAEHSFKTLQASSYSRKSVTTNEKGWFDNADASQYIRIEKTKGRTEHVLMDVDGPGAIVRFWSTWHAQQFSMGTLRFYFDNATVPQIAGRIDQIISSNTYIESPLSQTTSPFLENEGWFSGHNLYFPLPYAKHCKVTYEKADASINDVLYYQINYRKYNSGTLVETYVKGDLEKGKYKKGLREVRKKLKNLGAIAEKCEVSDLKGILNKGEVISTHIEGSRAIKKIVLKIKAKNREQALRSTVLEMEFDGESTVWVPIGDFFGTGYKTSAYTSWVSNVSDSGEMALFFPMPFQNSAKITVHNFGKQTVELLKMEVYNSNWEWDDRSLYFHANWRNYSNVATSKKRDVNFITISGKGKYVGDALTLFNNSYEWWGEGDEKIYVDGEKFPSNFGTGTEDYYGYAWCSVADFSAPFIAQPIGDGNRSPGLTVNNRWRSLDVIPFDKSLKFDMEIWHWADTKIDYAPTTYWYGTKDAKATYFENVERVQLPVKLSDKFEGESFSVKNVKGGNVIIEAFLSYEWSARNHLLWRNIKKNDELETVFYSEEERKGKLTAVFTHAPDYVIVDVLLNGKLIFEDLDLYSDQINVKKHYFENGRLIKGDNVLKFKVKGLNKNNTKADKMGLDYLIVN